jgi:uncharacterized protein YegP (UPF0339 family)
MLKITPHALALWAQAWDPLFHPKEYDMAGWFEISKSKDDQFHFVLKAANAETILTSELYKTRVSAENGIASVQSNCSADDRYEKKDASNGKFFFNLKAANHQVIGTSQMYATAQSRDGGMASVKSNGGSKTVKDSA